MFNKKNTVLTFMLLTYAIPSYAMLTYNQSECALLNRIAQDNYQPTTEDDLRLAKILAPDENSVRDLPKMIVAASAYLTTFDPSKEETAKIKQVIKEIIERAENSYCAQLDKGTELTDEAKQQIAQELYCSPYIYRDGTTTLFSKTQRKHPLTTQFDEFHRRSEIMKQMQQTLEAVNNTIDKQLSKSEDKTLKSTIMSGVNTQESLILAQLSQKTLEHNKQLTIERMQACVQTKKSTITDLEQKITKLEQQIQKIQQSKLPQIKIDLQNNPENEDLLGSTITKIQETVQQQSENKKTRLQGLKQTLAETQKELTNKRTEKESLESELKQIQGGGWFNW